MGGLVGGDSSWRDWGGGGGNMRREENISVDYDDDEQAETVANGMIGEE